MARATCPACGNVELAVSDLVIDPHGYRFECPVCRTSIATPASRPVLELLVHAGARVASDIPAEVLETKVGSPLTEADVETFAVLVEQDGWFDELLRLIDIDID